MFKLFSLIAISWISSAVASEAPLLLYSHANCEDEFCVVYEMFIQRDGQIRLMAREGLELSGAYKSSLPKDSLDAYEDLLESADLFNKKTTYTHVERSIRTSYLEYFSKTGNSVNHRIVNTDSRELDEVEDRLEKLVSVLEWIKEPAVSQK